MPDPNQAAQLLNTLRTPTHALPAFGDVHDQKTGRFQKYDPLRITDELPLSVLNYMSTPPRLSTGETKFLTILGYRQGGMKFKERGSGKYSAGGAVRGKTFAGTV